jgi:hypothetical protein
MIDGGDVIVQQIRVGLVEIDALLDGCQYDQSERGVIYEGSGEQLSDAPRCFTDFSRTAL